MKKIVAFGASSSTNSINKQLAAYAAAQISNAEVRLLDLNDYEMPIYSEDREREEGIPSQAYLFKETIADTDGIIISFAEHNSSYTAAFKNIYDWISRIEKIVWYNKPMWLLATSNGAGGAQHVLKAAHSRMSIGNPHEIPSFSLPEFSKNFESDKGIKNKELQLKFNAALEVFSEQL